MVVNNYSSTEADIAKGFKVVSLTVLSVYKHMHATFSTPAEAEQYAERTMN
jgi:hypothetical protein